MACSQHFCKMYCLRVMLHRMCEVHVDVTVHVLDSCRCWSAAGIMRGRSAARLPWRTQQSLLSAAVGLAATLCWALLMALSGLRGATPQTTRGTAGRCGVLQLCCRHGTNAVQIQPQAFLKIAGHCGAICRLIESAAVFCVLISTAIEHTVQLMLN